MRGDRLFNHMQCESWLRCKARFVRHMRGCHPDRIIRPGFGKIQSPIDEGMAMARNVSCKHTDLAVGDLACRSRILACHTAGRLALLQEASLINNQHRIVVGEMLDNIIAHDVAKLIRLPPAPPKDRLLTPWAR